MKNKLSFLLIYCAVLSFEIFAANLKSENPYDPLDRPIKEGTPSAIPLAIQEVLPDLFLITGRGANAIVRRTTEGLILVDNKVQYNVVWRELSAMLKNDISDLPIRYAFITHHHADHGGLNQKVIDTGAELIGHENVVEILKTYKSIIAPINPAAPTITFSERLEVKLGGVKAVAYSWGASHTLADIVVYFPDLKAVAVGDMIYSDGLISIDITDGHGSVLGMLERLNNLLGLDFDIAIPGHGKNTLTRAEVIEYQARLARTIEILESAVKEGTKPENIVEHMNAQIKDLGFELKGHFWGNNHNLNSIYHEIQQSIVE